MLSRYSSEAILQNIFLKQFSKSQHSILLRYPGGWKFRKSLTVKEIETILCCHFWQKFENSKWPPFLKNLPKVRIAYCLHTLGVENSDEIALSLTVKEIKAIVFCHFWQKFENSKWPSFLKKNSKVSLAYSLDTLGV